MGIREEIKKNENIFKGEKNVKYLFFENINSDMLIVTFPAFSPPGKPPVYNYISTLQEAKAHKLYLLDDYGPRGSYLIGEKRDSSIENSVISLIGMVCKKYKIKAKNVILHGSSKGGFCALYFGIKYRFGYIIAGGPQTKLGSYLINTAPEVVEYMAGGREKKDITYLDNLLYELLYYPLNNFPTIFIHVGRGDHHYKEHILPFIESLDKKSIIYELDVRNYSSHAAAGIFYPDYLLRILNRIDPEIIDLKPLIKNSEIGFKENSLFIRCEAEGQDLEYSYFIFNEDSCIKESTYQNEGYFNFPIETKGEYCAKIHVKDKNNNVNTIVTDEIIIK